MFCDEEVVECFHTTQLMANQQWVEIRRKLMLIFQLFMPNQTPQQLQNKYLKLKVHCMKNIFLQKSVWNIVDNSENYRLIFILHFIGYPTLYCTVKLVKFMVTDFSISIRSVTSNMGTFENFLIRIFYNWKKPKIEL